MTKKQILLAAGLIINSVTCYACLCYIPAFEDSMQEADEIFIGSIIRFEEVIDSLIISPEEKVVTDKRWRYYFRADKKWKGNNDRILVIESDLGNCSFRFPLTHHEILVYATRTGDYITPGSDDKLIDGARPILTTSICDRTTASRGEFKKEWYDSDIAALGSIPQKVLISGKSFGENRVHSSWRSSQLGYAVIGMAAIITALTVYIIIDKRKGA